MGHILFNNYKRLQSAEKHHGKRRKSQSGQRIRPLPERLAWNVAAGLSSQSQAGIHGEEANEGGANRKRKWNLLLPPKGKGSEVNFTHARTHARTHKTA